MAEWTTARLLKWCIASALAVLAVSALGGWGSSNASPATTTGPTTPATPSTAVTIRIMLPRTRVVAGPTINGTALITNNTSKTITVEACAADGWIDVGLVNHKITFDPATSSVACAPTVHLTPGLNRMPITVTTTFQSCSPTDAHISVNHPRCTSTGMPLLPVGHYTTKVITSGLPSDIPTPQPVSVTLLAK